MAKAVHGATLALPRGTPRAYERVALACLADVDEGERVFVSESELDASSGAAAQSDSDANVSQRKRMRPTMSSIVEDLQVLLEEYKL